MQFQKLYKKTSTGALQEWSIWTEGNTIKVLWGQTDGAKQETSEVIKEGKNLGKRNQTTPEEQADLEAKAKWELKKKKNLYVDDPNAAMAGEVDEEMVEGGITPMLAHRYDQHGHKISWPAYLQPKLDGHRCIAVIENNTVSLWSRTRKLITGVPHIISQLEVLAKQYKQDLILDGELYSHQNRENFEELTSFIRQETPKPGCEMVEYHIYDLPSASKNKFSDRFKQLQQDIFYPFISKLNLRYLHLVETSLVEDEEETMMVFEKFLASGHEGAIVRNAYGLYVNKRSYDLQKIKEFMDSEFLVVGVNEGKGRLAGHAIFVCQTDEGKQFAAKMIGSLDNLKRYITNPELALGKMLTVKYQGLTKANGLPRSPVAVRFREEL